MSTKKGFLLIGLLACLLAISNFPKSVLANWSVWDTPVVYYNFEGQKETAYIKDQVGSNDLVLSAISGSASGINNLGKYGRRAEFNGSTDYGVVQDSAQFSQTGSFSVETWVKFDTVSDTGSDIQTVLAKWDETTDIRSYRLIIETDSDGRAWPKFQISTDGTAANIKTVTGKTQILANQWYLFQGYYNATSPGTVYLYVNGVREGSTGSVGTSIADTSANFYLGATKTGASTYSHLLTGSIDEVRLFSGTRTDGSLAYSLERGKPVVRVTFDDGSGFQVMNRVDNFTRAALINFPTDNSQWVAGNNNYGLEFDGSNDYVDLGNHARFQLGGAISISLWIKISSLGNYALVSQPHTNGYTFQLTSGGELEFGAIGGTTASTTGAGISADEWTHVAVSYDGSNAFFYVDGRLISSPALSLWSVADGTTFLGRAGSTPNYFVGKMDDLLIYPYDRTLFEIYVDHLGGAVKFGQLQALEPANSQVACPQGFIHVPGDPLYGTADFCVAKYEAKCDVDGDGIGETATGDHASCNTTYDTWGNILSGCRCIEDKGGQIVSSAAGAPIARIAQDAGGSGVDAITYCQSIGGHLITNNEWMTIARNVEKLGANWCALNGTGCGNSPGSQYLVAGHNDNGPALGLQASTDDSQPCYGTVTKDTNPGCGNGATQRRTHFLSNGEVIWDLAGNLLEWTNDTIMGADKPVGTDGSWVDWPNVSDYGSLTYDALKPSDNSWNLNQRVGRYYQGSASGGPYAFLRGAYWKYSSHAGVSALTLYIYARLL
ncbi:MAG: LamG domain-containing protein [Patescibacteria group bacterium]|jgi:hypothetical protein